MWRRNVTVPAGVFVHEIAGELASLRVFHRNVCAVRETGYGQYHGLGRRRAALTCWSLSARRHRSYKEENREQSEKSHLLCPPEFISISHRNLRRHSTPMPS